MKTLLETDLAVALSTDPLQLLRKDIDFSKMYIVMTDKLDNIKFGRGLAIKKKKKKSGVCPTWIHLVSLINPVQHHKAL